MLLKRHGRPREIVTNKLRSYGAALEELGIDRRHYHRGRHINNRAEKPPGLSAQRRGNRK